MSREAGKEGANFTDRITRAFVESPNLSLDFISNAGNVAGDIADWAGDSIGGVVGGGKEIFSLIPDVATAAIDDHEPFWRSTRDSLNTRLGNAMNEWFGKGRGFHRFASGIVPGDVVGQEIGDIMDWGYEWGEEHLRDPISQHIAYNSLLAQEAGRGIEFQGDLDTEETPQALGGFGPEFLDPTPLLRGVAESMGISTHWAKEYFDDEKWAQAKQISEALQVGQIATAAARGINMSEPDDVAELMDTEYFHWASGTMDALAVSFADPLFFLPYGAGKAKNRYFTRPLPNSQHAKAFFQPKGSLARDVKELGPGHAVSRRLFKSTADDANAAIQRIQRESQTFEEATGKISDLLFRPLSDPFSERKAYLLNLAPDNTARNDVWKIMMGDDPAAAIQRMEKRKEEIGKALTESEEMRARIFSRQTGREGILPSDDAVNQTLSEWVSAEELYAQGVDILENAIYSNRQMDPWYLDASRFVRANDTDMKGLFESYYAALQKQQNIINQVDILTGSGQQTVPRAGDVAGRLQKSQIYNMPGTGRIIRAFVEKRPFRQIDLDDQAMFARHAYRSAIEAGLDVDTAQHLRGRATQLRTPGERARFFENELNDRAMRKIMDDADIDETIMEQAIFRARYGTQVAKSMQRRSRDNRFAGEGDMDQFMYRDPESGVISHHIFPISQTQTAEFVSPIDWKAVRGHINRLDESGILGPWKKGGLYAGKQMASEVLETFNHYWKPTVLARPAWPVRVVTDENLRLLSKFGVMANMKTIRPAFNNLANRYGEALGINRSKLRTRLDLDRHFSLMEESRAVKLANQRAERARQTAPENRTPEMQEAIELGSQVPSSGAAAVTPELFSSSAGYLLGYALAGHMGGLFGSGTGYALARKLKTAEFTGLDPQSILGIRGIHALDQDGLFRDKLSMGKDHSKLLHDERALHSSLRGMKEEYGSILGSDPGYREGWINLVSRQIRQDPVRSKLVLEGQSIEEVMHWLRNTPEGRQYTQSIPHAQGFTKHRREIAKEEGLRSDGRATALEISIDDAGDTHYLGAWMDQSPETWLDELRQHDLWMMGHSDEVQNLVRQGNTSQAYDQLAAQFPDPSTRPTVNAGISQELGGKKLSFFQKWTEFNDKVMELLGTIPTDELSRHPAFSMYFQDSMHRRIKAFGPENAKKNADWLFRQQKHAREEALHKMRTIMYDLQERSQMGMAMRFIMPFYHAGQEVLSAWTRITAQKPQIAYYAGRLWDAPRRNGLMYEDEEQGRTYLNFRLPEAVGDALNEGIFRNAVSQNNVMVPTTSFHPFEFEQGMQGFFLGGLFGTGPIAQYPLDQLASRNPDLRETEGISTIMDGLLPFGPRTEETGFGMIGEFLEHSSPAWFRRGMEGLRAHWRDKEELDESVARNMGRVFQTRATKIALGEDDEYNPEDLKDPEVQKELVEYAEDTAIQVNGLSAVARFFSPFPPQFRSPYQGFIDSYHEINEALPIINQKRAEQNLPPLDADQIFLENYGEEYMALTSSMTKSNDGLPPLEGVAKWREEHEDVINNLNDSSNISMLFNEEFLGSNAEFSTAFYRHQLRSQLKEGSLKTQRETRDPQEWVDDPQVKTGWIKHGRLMDYIEAQKIDRGLPTLSPKEATDLRMMKEAGVRAIAKEYPAWWEEYNAELSRPEHEFNKFLEDLGTILSQEGTRENETFDGVRQYVALREEYLRHLQSRGFQGNAKSLNAQANNDLRLLFQHDVNSLVQSNPAFAQFYHRYLARDPMMIQTMDNPFFEPTGGRREQILDQ